MEERREEVQTFSHNTRVIINCVKWCKMMSFSPTDTERIIYILYRIIEKEDDLSCLPVWLIENINKHPSELAGEGQYMRKQNGCHFLTKAEINLDSTTFDVVADSPNHWVKKGETERIYWFPWCVGLKRTYIWKSKPGNRRRKRGDTREREKYWRMGIYTLSPEINAPPPDHSLEWQAEAIHVRDVSKLSLWKLVTINPTLAMRANRRRRRDPEIQQQPAALPTVAPIRESQLPETVTVGASASVEENEQQNFGQAASTQETIVPESPAMEEDETLVPESPAMEEDDETLVPESPAMEEVDQHMNFDPAAPSNEEESVVAETDEELESEEDDDDQ